MQQKCDEFDWISDFNIDRTIGGLSLLKVNFIGNNLANNVIDSAIKYLKESGKKVGAWVRRGEPPIYVAECSACHQKFLHHFNAYFPKYCPECGAKMESIIIENQSLPNDFDRKEQL